MSHINQFVWKSVALCGKWSPVVLFIKDNARFHGNEFKYCNQGVEDHAWAPRFAKYTVSV